MTHGRERRGSVRTLTLAAIGVACAAALVALVMFLGRTPARIAPLTGAEQGTIPPDIKDVPTTQTSRGVTQLGSGKGMYVQVADRNDPGRVAGELVAETSEPLEARRYLLTRPRAWAFLGDGRTLYAEADSGRAFIPDTGPGSRPEEGTLKGNVVIKLFPAMDRRPEPATDTPELTVTTQSMVFNGTLGELRFDEPVDFTGERFSFRGRGIVVLFNEARQQLELLRIDEPLSPLTILPGSRVKSSPTPASPPGGVSTPPQAPVASAPARTPVETAYRLVAQREVHLMQGAREIWSDRLDAWVRLQDNKLNDGVLGAAPASWPSIAPEFRSVRGVVSAMAIAAFQPDSSRFVASDEPVVITWTGPLEVRPSAIDAPELAANDVFVRLVGDEAGQTRIADRASKAEGAGRTLEYGATRREASLIETSPALARFAITDRGHAASERFDVNLGSGEVRVPGAGTLVAATSKPESPERTLAWTREASFLFDTESNTMTSRLREARMTGEVIATDSVASIAGESLSATFVSDESDSPRLSFLKVIGRALARDGRDGSMAADTIGITFAPGESDPQPTHVEAHGNVLASRPDTTLESETLSATIARDDKDNLSPTTILATGFVRYTGPDGVVASTQRLEADARARTACLRGEDSTVARGSTSVTGNVITLNEEGGLLDVDGPGRFAHAAKTTTGEPEQATATWTRAMRFDDRAGTIRCDGNVAALWTRGSLERHTMGGDHVAMDLAPAEGDGASPDAQPAATNDREIRTVAIRGDATPGWFELRQYAPQQGGNAPSVERELRLTGPVITGDAAAGTIEVDGEGSCRLLDLRAESPRVDEASPAGPVGGSLRGAARFTWKTSMRYERSAGTITMRDRVTLTHVRLDENFRTELDCDLLVARIRESNAAPHESSLGSDFRGELVSASATGNVWMRSNAKEVTAASLEYDAVKRLADARAPAGGTVIYLDPATGSPVEAERAIWNLSADRVELRGVRTIVSPR
ncbi:MAG: hypothetical protein HUU18_10090 [Phycisphaerales bacterium]|nr:hypothetical protein [Phycisphaerales bacterium]